MSASRTTGLGKGFDALIPQDFDSAILMDQQDRIKILLTSDIVPNLEQPRKHFDSVRLEELAASIARHGILQPLVVTPVEHKKYMIIAGERRWRAATLAGLERVPVIVRSTEQLEQLEIALIENVQRVDLSPLEQAASIARLHEQFTLSYKEIAGRLGKAETTVSNIVRLLLLPLAAQTALHDGAITEGHARAILGLKAEADQLALLRLIRKYHWTVRQAEQYVVGNREGSADAVEIRRRVATVTTPETQKLSRRLKAPVTIKRSAKGGKLEIAFTSDEELSRIIGTLDAA